MARHRKALGSQPHEHWDMADAAFSKALKFSEKAHSNAIKGKCFDSFENIILAHESIGEASTHADASNRENEFSESSDAVAMEISDAESVFNQKCLVGGGLSGLRRRRKSR